MPCRMPLMVACKALSILKLTTMAYNSEASMLRVIRLHLVKLQCIILPVILIELFFRVSLISTTINPIWLKRSLLLAKEALTKIKSFNPSETNFTNRSPLLLFLICHCGRLFKYLVLSFVGCCVCAANDRENEASG